MQGYILTVSRLRSGLSADKTSITSMLAKGLKHCRVQNWRQEQNRFVTFSKIPHVVCLHKTLQVILGHIFIVPTLLAFSFLVIAISK